MDFSKLRGSRIETLVSTRKEAEKKSKNYGSGERRVDFIQLEEGLNVLRLCPPHSPDQPNYQPIRTTYLEVDIPVVDEEGKEIKGKTERKKKRIYFKTNRMIKHYYSSTGDRPLEKIKGLKIIDIGGANSFAHGFLDAILDIRQPPPTFATNIFVGDMNMPEVWKSILDHVEKHGKWDYCICTGTLEDIANPIYVCRMMEKIALAGFIYVPSKYRELAKFADIDFRGYRHHRWVFNPQGDKVIAYPKTSYFESKKFDNVHLKLDGKEELLIEWEGSIEIFEVNDGMPFNGDGHLMESYDSIIND